MHGDPAGAYGRTFPETIDKDFKAAVARYWYMIMLYFSRDENVQVSGMVFVLDFTNCPLRALTMYSISEARDVVKFQVRASLSTAGAKDVLDQ